MARHQNKLSRFWQELKRRRVIHVITVYASAAFAIIEIVNNLTVPLNLPTSLSTIIIIVLAVAFPLVIILSWLYDLTSGSLERTKPMEDIPEEEKPEVPNAWKIATYVSFAVIVGLIVLNIASRGSIIKPGMIQSMVVLPFNNYTGDENLEYFASGMHSSLIGDMGKVSGLRILSEPTSKMYKNAEKSVPQIASELKVDAVVEPTITCFGDSICVQVKVFSAFPEEKLLWVTEYKEDRRNILNLYGLITKQIAAEVKVELTPEEDRLLARSIIVDREAYDAYLKSQQYWSDFSPERFKKALALDPDLPDAHYLNGWIALVSEWDWAKAEREFLKALTINPNDAMSRIYYAHLLCILHRYEEAEPQARLALELDPLNPMVKIMFSTSQLFINFCEADLTQIEKLLADDPKNFSANVILNYKSAYCGDNKTAIRTEKLMLQTLMGEQFNEDGWKEIERIFDVKGYNAAYEKMNLSLPDR